jgi:diacylglycerol kinase family enzyme
VPEGIFEQTGTTVKVKPAMRRVALIYNPASGQISARRAAAVEDALAVFRDAGVEAAAFVTR